MESARVYQNMTVVQLRELARANKVRLPYGVNKAQMVETLFRQLGSGMKPAQAPAEQPDIGLYKPKPLGFYDEEYGTSNPVVPQMLKAGLLGSGHGLLEVQPGGYGFLRAQNGTPGADDIYVSIAQIRRFNLHSGDEIVGKTRPKRMGDRYNALMYIESVNGENPEIARVRRPFDSLTPIHPNRRLTLEGEGEPGDPSMRLMDFIAAVEAACEKEAVKEYLPMQPGDVYQTNADTSALQRDMGYKPSKDIREGIRETVAWFKSYYHLE